MPYKRKKNYNDYMRKYMKTYRAQERRLIRQARQMLGIQPKKRGRKKK